MRVEAGTLARKSKGRTLITSSDPANFVIPDTGKDKPTDWRVQQLMQRHRVPNSLAQEIVRAHYGEARDAE